MHLDCANKFQVSYFSFKHSDSHFSVVLRIFNKHFLKHIPLIKRAHKCEAHKLYFTIKSMFLYSVDRCSFMLLLILSSYFEVFGSERKKCVPVSCVLMQSSGRIGCEFLSWVFASCCVYEIKSEGFPSTQLFSWSVVRPSSGGILYACQRLLLHVLVRDTLTCVLLRNDCKHHSLKIQLGKKKRHAEGNLKRNWDFTRSQNSGIPGKGEYLNFEI
jgi:hypothetical protein